LKSVKFSAGSQEGGGVFMRKCKRIGKGVDKGKSKKVREFFSI